ncbi:MAG: hypothetical protein AB1529_06955 [Candidatus Micrarchaeota archaeon]
MASIRTLTRIYAAEVRAEAMSLEGTAGRLEALRRQLSDYKNLSEDRRRDKLRWALAKLDDTEKSLEKEAAGARAGEESRQFEHKSKAIGRVAKFVGYIGVLQFASEAFSRLAGSTYLSLAVPAAIAAAAFIFVSKAVDAVVGTSFDESVKRLGNAIEECRGAILKAQG